MPNNNWTTYWDSVDGTFIEKQIQKYKVNKGYKKLLESLPSMDDRCRVLEVGAGKAWLSRILKEMGWYATALDNNSKVVSENSSAVDKYVMSRADSMPFEDNSFDLVLSCGLVEHFNMEELKRMIAEMRRVGKTVVAWLPTCDFSWKMIWTVRNLFGGDVYTKCYAHKPRELEGLFKSLGFKNVRTGIVPFMGFLKYMYVYGN